MGFFSGLTLLICVILLVALALCVGALLGFMSTLLAIKKQFPEAYASIYRKGQGRDEDDEQDCEI